MAQKIDNKECAGCGQTASQVMEQWETTEEEMEEEAVYTNCGNWYCHSDCYRDSDASGWDFR